MTSSMLPDRDSFDVAGTYLNAAHMHPITRRSAGAIRDYVDVRALNGRRDPAAMMDDRQQSKELFAKLINCSVEELAWIPSTMAGENFVVAALGLTAAGSNGGARRVVTDALHFEGSLYMYGELAARGLPVTVVEAKNHAIEIDDLAAAIVPGTRLVAVSLVSASNGFQHDLEAICKIAHERGAMVYADIIQAAGAVPIDVRATGVDFCACASYKWLMGDFGAGFLYVRADRLRSLDRPQYGYRQLSSYISHRFPHDTPGASPVSWLQRSDAGGHFEVGTLGNAAVATLRHGLEFISSKGVEQIELHRQPLLALLHAELPRLGFEPLTKPDSRSPIVAFAYKDARSRLAGRLHDAGVNLQLYADRIRVSPSVYNDVDDIERLIAALR